MLRFDITNIIVYFRLHYTGLFRIMLCYVMSLDSIMCCVYILHIHACIHTCMYMHLPPYKHRVLYHVMLYGYIILFIL